jgi:ERF superfamily
MQRTSGSIGSLAAALAKAQGKLTNPEKSLSATIHTAGPGATEKTFRYAPLSIGLDIVRKTLGQHEIAVVQTTSLDQSAGIINLTTALAHSSGEWIASDWPVCAISETATPRRMGAALTYARRYALFTLVGIAGEDDLDAPDMIAPASLMSNPEKPAHNSNDRLPTPRTALHHKAGIQRQSAEDVLGPKESAELRDRLTAELNELHSGDDAAMWAHRRLPNKNRLTADDARLVEESFRTKLETFATPAAEQIAASEVESFPAIAPDVSPAIIRTRSEAIDKSALTLPEPRRIRDRDHVKFVAQQPCLICGRSPSDAHHVRFAQSRALGHKVSDEFTVPLCRGHHREVHRSGKEADWWSNAGIDPMIAARGLWLEKHPLPRRLNAPSADATMLASDGRDERKPKRRRRAAQSSNGKTEPVEKVANS